MITYPFHTQNNDEKNKKNLYDHDKNKSLVMMNKILITKTMQINTQKINTNKTKFYNSQYW